jgi:hypothetical protein
MASKDIPSSDGDDGRFGTLPEHGCDGTRSGFSGLLTSLNFGKAPRRVSMRNRDHRDGSSAAVEYGGEELSQKTRDSDIPRTASSSVRRPRTAEYGTSSSQMLFLDGDHRFWHRFHGTSTRESRAQSVPTQPATNVCPSTSRQRRTARSRMRSASPNRRDHAFQHIRCLATGLMSSRPGNWLVHTTITGGFI